MELLLPGTRPRRVLGPGKVAVTLALLACLPELSLVIQADRSYWLGSDPATHTHSHLVAKEQ